MWPVIKIISHEKCGRCSCFMEHEWTSWSWTLNFPPVNHTVLVILVCRARWETAERFLKKAKIRKWWKKKKQIPPKRFHFQLAVWSNSVFFRLFSFCLILIWCIHLIRFFYIHFLYPFYFFFIIILVLKFHASIHPFSAGTDPSLHRMTVQYATFLYGFFFLFDVTH